MDEQLEVFDIAMSKLDLMIRNKEPRAFSQSSVQTWDILFSWNSEK